MGVLLIMDLRSVAQNVFDADYRRHGSGVNEPGRNLVVRSNSRSDPASPLKKRTNPAAFRRVRACLSELPCDRATPMRRHFLVVGFPKMRICFGHLQGRIEPTVVGGGSWSS